MKQSVFQIGGPRAHITVIAILFAGLATSALLIDLLQSLRGVDGPRLFDFVLDRRFQSLYIIWAGCWAATAWIASRPPSRLVRLAVPVAVGLTLLLLWELVAKWYGIQPVILPPPTAIARAFAANLPLLWGDFVQTILKGGLSGYVIGIAAAFATGIAVDRSDFLRRGLLPVANFLAALPIVGTAPILVAWFGFGWQSKSAVVVVMVFFPMLVNIVAGLSDTSSMQRDLMRTYGASYWATLRYLKLPAALPFIFNGLKIATTLALTGAIVAEFFGSPTLGLGFRINQSIGQLALDRVWAAIVVAALSSGLFYALVAALERRLTFWHPSQRKT